MIVRGLYPIIARVPVAERSMIMLLVIEYLASMLPDELFLGEDQWFSPGDLEDLVCMATTIAYKLMPDASKLLQFVGDVFEQAVQSCRAREEVLDACRGEERIDPPREVRVHGGTMAAAATEVVPVSGGNTHTVVPTDATERQRAMRVPVPPQSGQPDVTISARQRILMRPAESMETDNERQTSPPYVQEPVPARRSMFVESERRDMSQTPAWMFQCDECGGAFVEAEKLRIHREAVHSVWPDQRPVARPAQANAPVHHTQPSASPEVAQIQSQVSALTTLVSQMRSMMSGEGGDERTLAQRRTEGGDERPLAQRRSRRTNAGAALCKECNFPTKFCECDLSAESDVEVRSSTRNKGNGGRARYALSSIAGLPLSDIFKRHRVLLVPEMWLPYFASGAQPRDLRAALEARYVNDKRFDNHETIKANNRHMIESIMLAITAALMPMEFERPPNELDTPSLMHSMRYLQENRVRAKGGEKAAQAYRETVENDSGPEDERRAEAAGAKVSAKAEELRQTSRYKPESVDKPEGKKGQYKRCPDAQWQKMSAAEKTAWRKNNPL